MSAFQRDKRAQKLINLRPDFYVQKELRCLIQEVYDPGRKAWPPELTARVLQNPGYVYARVVLVDRQTVFYLPLVHSLEEIYMLYGHPSSIIGVAAKIIYRGMEVQEGRVQITSNPFNLPVESDSMSIIYDIGNVI